MLKKIMIILLCCSFCLSVNGSERDKERQLYLRADHALKKKDFTNFERLKKELTLYPLYPYLVYDELKYKIQQTKPMTVTLKTLNDFETKVPDFPFHSTLRQQWLMKMAQAKKWKEYTDGYQTTKNEALQCQFHFAKYQLTKDPSHLKNAKDLWLVGYSQDPACDHLFKEWKKQFGLSRDLLNKRIQLSLENKQYDFAKQLSKQLPKNERSWVESWEKLIKQPSLLEKTNQTKSELITQAMRNWAKQDPEKASKWWKDHAAKYSLSAEQSNKVNRDLAVCLAQQRSPLAEEWLRSLSTEAKDNPAKEWQVRIHLAQGQWEKVKSQIEALPEKLKDEPIWQYWLARSKEQLNDKDSAKTIYEKLAQHRNYYGFLASTRLNQSLSMEHEELKVDPSQLHAVFSIPAIERFEELRLVKKEAIARVEWFKAVEKMSMDERHAAAKIAQKMGLHDLAIFTLAKSPFKNDLALRFPLAHEPEVLNFANQYNLDPSWVFAIARQESAFHADAISKAGARGIMQLLPSTAKQVASQYHVTYHSEKDLHQPIVNIQLGTAYLSNLKKNMVNHIILATASYNAGPGRIPRWIYDETIDTDQWIETIPYQETREYVKNVMAFMAVYRYRLGNPPAFALLLKPIPNRENYRLSA